MEKAKIGIIGGSGLYEVHGAKIIEEVNIETPWGRPSDSITIAEIEGTKVAFLPRHGRGHIYLPSELNSRANIAAMKMLGVEEIYSFSAVGSLKMEIKPTHFVIPDQVIDRTRHRVEDNTFYGNGIVGHVSFAHPFCARLHDVIIPAASEIGITLHQNETLICMEGPAFSSRAESRLYKSWGAGVINMTTLPEAKLAREAEICYTVICMSTDYDSWNEEEEHVTVDKIVEYMKTNSENGKKLIPAIIKRAGGERSCACGTASKFAVFTDRKKFNPEQAKKLKTILPDYF